MGTDFLSERKKALFCRFPPETWMDLKGSIMENTDNNRDPLPEEFSSEEEAGEFWDTHSLTDYEEFLEPVELDVDLTGRHF